MDAMNSLTDDRMTEWMETNSGNWRLGCCTQAHLLGCSLPDPFPQIYKFLSSLLLVTEPSFYHASVDRLDWADWVDGMGPLASWICSYHNRYVRDLWYCALGYLTVLCQYLGLVLKLVVLVSVEF